MRRKLIILAFALVYLMAAQAALIDDYIRTFPKSVINVMAQRDARYHHYLWHQVRQGWNRFSDSTKDAFRKIGWEPPNPARNFDSNGNSIAVFNNYAGEDFLYMHREMIKRVNKIISDNKEPIGKISGWSKIPGLGDKDWPVPPRYTVTGDSGFTSSINSQKTDSFYTRSIVPGEKLFTDPVQLRKMSLNEFGMRLETTVHTWIHMRWSSANVVGYRSSYKGTIPYVDPKWDDVRYDWMGDTYCSHVHPLFWKVHGWVDDRLEDWRKANGIGTIRWRGTWTGGPMNNVASVTGVKNSSFRGANAMANAARGSETLSVMDQAFKILQESNFQDMGFGEKVIVPEWKMQNK